MKLFVFADTHGRSQRLMNTAGQHESEADAFLHLGDGAGEAVNLHEVFPHVPLYLVPGNCDPGQNQFSESKETFGGLRFFLTHGHAYGVKEDLDSLWWQAKKWEVNAALYGHTHIPNYTFRGGIHLFNPGSLSMPRFGPPTYGLITIESTVPTFEIIKYKD